LPPDLTGVVIHGRQVAGHLLFWDCLPRASHPQPAARIGRAYDVISRGPMDIKRVGEAEYWINGHGGGYPTEHARQHPCSLRRRRRPHIVLRHHRFREANEATVLAVVNIGIPDLARTWQAGNHVAVIVLNINQNRRGGWIKIPNVMRDILEVADIFSGIEIK